VTFSLSPKNCATVSWFLFSLPRCTVSYLHHNCCLTILPLSHSLCMFVEPLSTSLNKSFSACVSYLLTIETQDDRLLFWWFLRMTVWFFCFSLLLVLCSIAAVVCCAGCVFYGWLLCLFSLCFRLLATVM
jgi:hypothetical protein